MVVIRVFSIGNFRIMRPKVSRPLERKMTPLKIVIGFLSLLALGGCGVSPGCRAVTGAGIGAAGGAALGAIGGAAALGAGAGAAGGAVLGAATSPRRVNLGPSPFCY
jgi:osmotically inducible lipoprotein OsmB